MKETLLIFLRGLAMGAADVVPGVSGGTIAFITGIYPRLLNAIRAFDGHFAKLLLKGRFREAMARIPWSFLLPLVAGIGCSIFSLAKLVIYLLHQHAISVWSFFFGLILASIALLLLDVRARKIRSRAFWPMLAFGALCAWWLSGGNSNTLANPGLLLYFAAAFVAICAMILPGISGAFILVLLGMYPHVMRAVADFNLPVLVVFALGCVCGLLCFARVLSWLFNNVPIGTLAFLIGLMAGSLRAVWPWKDGVWPALPPALDSGVALAALCCLAGIALPLAIQFFAGQNRQTQSS